jgi:CRP-like cAMP-binding protein
MRPLNLNDLPFNLNEIQVMLRFMGNEEAQEVKVALRAARRVMGGQKVTDTQEIIKGKEVRVLSAVEKVIFLKGVPFFQGMTVNQLKALSGATEEEFFSEDSAIFRQGDPGGTLYVVVSGKVGVERSNQAGTASSRVKDVDARGYFGETTLFDNSNCPTTALALRDTLCLKLRHEPFLALIQAYPDLSLQLIRVLSKQIQQTDEQVADLARRRSRTMHKVFDRLD